MPELSQARRRRIQRLHRPRTRKKEGLVLVEGVRAVREALDAGCDAVFAVLSRGAADTEPVVRAAEDLERRGVDAVYVDGAAFRDLAATDRPQGLLLVAREPAPPADALRGWRRILMLDAVQDPGNAGTLVRAAVAFGLDGVVALDGTVDVWSPKAVRAAAGLTFRLPVRAADWPAVAEELCRPRLVAEAGGRDIREVAPMERFTLVVGNEGAGARTEVRTAAEEVVKVPMAPGVESLNVALAGAVILHELTRDRPC